MTIGQHKLLPATHDIIAPDGSEVRILLSMTGGSMAHFRLAAGGVSRAVRHRTVEEVWYFLSGTGEMWQGDVHASVIIPLTTGLCLTIPPGVGFQFRALGVSPLDAVGVTMPPWPGAEEAEYITGPWTATSD